MHDDGGADASECEEERPEEGEDGVRRRDEAVDHQVESDVVFGRRQVRPGGGAVGRWASRARETDIRGVTSRALQGVTAG